MSLLDEMRVYGLADCEMNRNLNAYYCNGFWFAYYKDARQYADFLLNHRRLYRAIFTRSEIEAHAAEVTA
jgi:hypothetical protein